jgi:hypothetical protein
MKLDTDVWICNEGTHKTANEKLHDKCKGYNGRSFKVV